MDFREHLVTYFEELIQRDYRSSPSDYLIYLVISVRCQLDMGGIASVFDQLLRDEPTLMFFLDGLKQLNEHKLVQAFSLAHIHLKELGYFDDPNLEIYDLAEEDNEDMFLQDIAEKIREEDRLWELDASLCTLLPVTE